MDDQRKIRFLVSPIIFLAFAAWGIFWDSDPSHTFISLFPHLTWSGDDKTDKIVALLVGGGIAIFALGWIFGTVSYAFLRLLFGAISKCVGHPVFHEFWCDKETLDKLWACLNREEKSSWPNSLYAGVTFDFGILKRDHLGVHEWLVRRWNAFSIGVSSFVALIFSVIFDKCLGVTWTLWWVVPVAIVGISTLIATVTAWRDAWKMAAFQIEHLPPSNKL